MNCLRLSGSAWPETCSADTVVPRMTNRSTPASTTWLGELLGPLRRQRAGHGDPGVAISCTRWEISSGLIGAE